MAITLNGAPGAPVATTVTLTGTQTLTNKTLTSPTITDATFSGQQTGLEIAFAQSIVFEGTTADASETTLSAGEPTADRTVTLPNATDTLVGRATTDTLTNKTLTSPVLGGTTTSASGNIVVQPASYILEVMGGGSTVGQIQLNCPVNTHGQKIASQLHAEAASNTLTLPGGTTIGNSNAVLVSDTGTQTLTNKTLSGANIANAIIKGIEEDVEINATAATGTINIDVNTASIHFFTTAATANFTLNFRFSSSVSLNTSLATGDSITLVVLNTSGATAFFPNVIQIDGTSVTPKVPIAITAGNASAIDVYSFTIIKTASATFTVLETQTKFA